MKRLLLWLWLLTKRLYKRPAFLILLLLIPGLCLCYNAAARQDSGAATLALAWEAPEELTEEIYGELSQSELLRFIRCETAAQAELLVRTGKADEAWIFPEDLAGHLDAFVRDPRQDGFIRVLRREDSVLVGLAREKLSATLFPSVAKELYLHYLRGLPGSEGLSDQALLDCYDRSIRADRLFTFRDTGEGAAGGNYLLSPLRGLLALVTVLGGAAAALVYSRDTRRGTFCWVRHPWGFLPELGSQAVCTLHLSAAAGLCLGLCGLSPGFFRELGAVLLYGICAGVFGMLLRRLTRTEGGLAAVLPVLTVAMLVLCPVFFDLGALHPVQLLLPPTYYINAGADPRWLGYMAVYTCICASLCGVVKERKI